MIDDRGRHGHHHPSDADCTWFECRLNNEIAQLRAAVRAALDWFGSPDENATDHFERIAEDFRRDTGFLRPGKDAPAAASGDGEARMAAWIVWRDARNRKVRADLADALRKTSSP